mmetsp:Transcript_41438/g.119339  ORF Transcript_41438/g.119339 Transcript_41438/m.119339 type:complete len:215 (+) Transcript_41438:1715-2359(+)
MRSATWRRCAYDWCQDGRCPSGFRGWLCSSEGITGERRWLHDPQGVLCCVAEQLALLEDVAGGSSKRYGSSYGSGIVGGKFASWNHGAVCRSPHTVGASRLRRRALSRTGCSSRRAAPLSRHAGDVWRSARHGLADGAAHAGVPRTPLPRSAGRFVCWRGAASPAVAALARDEVRAMYEFIPQPIGATPLVRQRLSSRDAMHSEPSRTASAPRD